MMKKPQKEMILEILGRGETLTVLTALRRIGCYALSQRVGELAREGHPIKSRWWSFTTDWGEAKQIKEYYMEQGQQEMDLEK